MLLNYNEFLRLFLGVCIVYLLFCDSLIMSRIYEELPNENIKVVRMGFAQTTCPTTKSLEDLFYPNSKTISEKVCQILEKKIDFSNLFNNEEDLIDSLNSNLWFKENDIDILKKISLLVKNDDKLIYISGKPGTGLFNNYYSNPQYKFYFCSYTVRASFNACSRMAG